MEAAILFFSLLCLPVMADLAAGQQAYKNGDYTTALKEFLPLRIESRKMSPGETRLGQMKM